MSVEGDHRRDTRPDPRGAFGVGAEKKAIGAWNDLVRRSGLIKGPDVFTTLGR